MHGAAAALRIEKKEPVEEFDFVRRADAAIEIVEISAAAERDVLAIVHVFAARKDIRRGAAAEIRPQLKQFYLPAGLSQRDAGRQTR